MSIYRSLDFINVSNEIRRIEFDFASCYPIDGLKTVDTDTKLSSSGNYYDKEVVGLWSNSKCIWKWIDGIDQEENKERNILIQSIRDKFTSKNNKNRNTRYNGYPYEYKSKHHKALFLEIVAALGLVKTETPKQRTTEVTAQPYDVQYNSNKYQEDQF